MVRVREQHLHFPIFFEATGQRPLSSADLPFPSLRGQGIVRDCFWVDCRLARGDTQMKTADFLLARVGKSQYRV